MHLGIRRRKAIVNGGSAGMGRRAVLALAREGVTMPITQVAPCVRVCLPVSPPGQEIKLVQAGG